MCLIVFHWNPASDTPLIVVGNRDEFYAREAEAAHWWAGERVLAGRDVHSGGTWMGVSKTGRFAALTNYRDPAAHKAHALSRGALVADFLAGECDAQSYLNALRPRVAGYNDFNLLTYDGNTLLGYESRFDQIVTFTPAVHGLSNARFDSSWPKTEVVKAGMPHAMQDDEALFALLADERQAPDAMLPQTGLSLEWERALSSPFIRLPSYGTRCTTLLRLGREQVQFRERRFEGGAVAGQTSFAFNVET